MEKTVDIGSSSSDICGKICHCGHAVVYNPPIERTVRKINTNNNTNIDDGDDDDDDADDDDDHHEEKKQRDRITNYDDWRRNDQYYNHPPMGMRGVTRAQSSESQYSDNDEKRSAWEADRYKKAYYDTDYNTDSSYRLSSQSSLIQSSPLSSSRMRSSRSHVRNCPDSAHGAVTSPRNGVGARVRSHNTERTQTDESPPPLQGLLKKRQYDERGKGYRFERLYPSDSIEQLVSNRKQKAWRRDTSDAERRDTYSSTAECSTRPRADHIYTPECRYEYPLRNTMSDYDVDEGRLPIFCTCKRSPTKENMSRGKRRQSPSKEKQPKRARSRKGKEASERVRNDTNNNATNARRVYCESSSDSETSISDESCDEDLQPAIERYVKCAIRQGRLNIGCSKSKKRAPKRTKKQPPATTRSKSKTKPKPKKQNKKNFKCPPKTSVSIVIVSSSGNIQVRPIL